MKFGNLEINERYIHTTNHCKLMPVIQSDKYDGLIKYTGRHARVDTSVIDNQIYCNCGDRMDEQASVKTFILKAA